MKYHVKTFVVSSPDMQIQQWLNAEAAVGYLLRDFRCVGDGGLYVQYVTQKIAE